MDEINLDFVIRLLDKHRYTLRDSSSESIERLGEICDTPNKRSLIDDLLLRFDYIDSDIYELMLLDIAHYIANNYNAEDTVIAAITFDESTDSSQRVLNQLHLPLDKAGYDCNFLLTKNRFQLIQHSKRPKAVIVDEFIGTGDTVLNRVKSMNGWQTSGIDVEFCFMAGLSDGINKVKNKGIKIYCPWIVNKAITDYYKDEELESMKKAMNELEETLASQINFTALDRYHFGYKGSEALFCSRGYNIPNNVFPIFWWKKDSLNKDIDPIFKRHQDGY